MLAAIARPNALGYPVPRGLFFLILFHFLFVLPQALAIGQARILESVQRKGASPLPAGPSLQ
jgi:hypothetical protein